MARAAPIQVPPAAERCRGQAAAPTPASDRAAAAGPAGRTGTPSGGDGWAAALRRLR